MGQTKVLDVREESHAHRLVEQFRTIVGPDHVMADPLAIEDYGRDKTEDYFFLPDVVVKPGSTEEVSELLKICNESRIPVTPRERAQA